MEHGEYFYPGSAWLKDRLNGLDGHLWKKARRSFLFRQNLASALNLFNFDYKAVQTISKPEGVTVIGSGKTTLDAETAKSYRQGQLWTDDAQNSFRTLLDRIVIRWMPRYLHQRRVNIDTLHRSLTPVPLQAVQKTYDMTDDAIDSYNVCKALEWYQACLVPLQYHELWSEVVSDFKNVETTLEERETVIETKLFYSQETLDEDEDGALVFGTNCVTFADNYKPLSKKLGLFDLVLITVNQREYFGMIVHVQQIKAQVASDNDTSDSCGANDTNQNDLKYVLHTTLGVYVSSTCWQAFQQWSKPTNNKKLAVKKLGNITSSRRMISAVCDLHQWPQHRSLLKPMLEDIYFDFPEGYDPLRISESNGFNLAQSKAIALAECMFEDQQERMHLIHGPPGTGKSRTIAGIVLRLLPKLSQRGQKRKILLCAPSNNACDELSRRILDEFTNQNIPYKHGTLVRIGCQPPDDYQLCNHFLDFMILEELVAVLKDEGKLDPNSAQETENRLMRHAKIVVSTLNYCGSTRMRQLKSCTEFVIIDEACQSLEADFLLPFQFKCTKFVLVGDPQQLTPCVLSDAGKAYGLSQSLYERLYSLFDGCPNGPISMLDIQYRMHPEICQFPSDHFYSGRLRTDPSVGESMRGFPLKPLYIYNIVASPHEYDNARSSFNTGEAECIRRFCDQLIAYLAEQPNAIVSSDSSSDEDEDDDDGTSTSSYADSTHSSDDISIRGDDRGRQDLPALPATDPRSIEIQRRIAVITPYKAQIRVLRSYLPNCIEIMTVDSSQGKEKDIVILSCVRSGDNIGFLDDMNRLNVMLTRSKNALYVFGNLTQLASQHPSWDALVSHANAKGIISDVYNLQPDLPFR